MSLNFPDFLGPADNPTPSAKPGTENSAENDPHNAKQHHLQHQQQHQTQNQPQTHSNQNQNQPETHSNQPQNTPAQPEFDALLRSKLALLDSPLEPFSPTFNANVFSQNYPQLGHYDAYAPPFGDNPPADSFHLPRELQGGIGTISSRRPSYAAESFTRSTGSYVPPAGGASSTAQQPNRVSLASLAAANNFMNSSRGLDSLADSLGSFSLNSNFSDFQARRPSQLADFSPLGQQSYQGFSGYSFNAPNSMGNMPGNINSGMNQGNMGMGMNTSNVNHNMNSGVNQNVNHNVNQGVNHNANQPSNQNVGNQNVNLSPNVNMGMGTNMNFQGNSLSPFASQNYQQFHPENKNQKFDYQGGFSASQMKLDNGLMIKDQYIVASPELKSLYSSVSRYFQDTELSNSVLAKLKKLLADDVVVKLINFIKNLNNLNFHHKMLCLVLNKNGRLDLLSYPNNSNIYLQRNDLVIVDGDRGKDLVMILEPHVTLDMAILFNFLKKIEHLRSLTINHNHGGASVKNNHCGGTHSTALNASAIIDNHSNDDNEFIVTLPTKQVLRFATPKEIQKLSGKFLEEKKAFITCYNKIKELGLSNDLTLINVEYQCDFKKLIFYYFANFKRIDFRGLIKELFKIYKTRIWLCAVLPYDRPDLVAGHKTDGKSKGKEGIPEEYNLSNEQIMNFSIKEFSTIATPSYFHSRNMSILIDKLIEDTKGNFYGFHQNSKGH